VTVRDEAYVVARSREAKYFYLTVRWNLLRKFTPARLFVDVPSKLDHAADVASFDQSLLRLAFKSSHGI
jgi:hypothetical protein